MIQKQSIINLPVAIAGISLGFLTLATVWEGLGFSFIRHVSVLFAITCIGLLLTKLVSDPKKVLSEFKNPITGSLSFTTTMAIMAISNYISKYHLQLAKFIWLSAIAIHIVMFFVFIFFMRKHFTFEQVVPSWFVPAVGVCVSVVTGQPMGFDLLSKIIFYYSFAWFLVLLPILIYRVKFYKVKIPSQANMTMAIFAAPASLCLAGYLGMFQPAIPILIILVPTSYVLTLYVYSLLPRFLRLPFSLGFAPLTFPLAIGVVATQRYATFLTSIGSSWAGFFTQIFFIQLIVATLVIGYVLYKTLELFIRHLKQTKCIKQPDTAL